MVGRPWALGCALAMSVACGEESDTSEFGSGTDSGMVTSGPSSSTGSETSAAPSGSTTGTATESSGSSSTGSDDVKFDMGVPDSPLPTEDGCQKIDFLFVIDNSGTMQSYQEELAASFPQFIEAVQTTVDVDDFHIMAVDTDAAPLACIELCGPEPGENSSCNGANCLGLPEPGTCEATLGAGRTTNRDGAPCPIEGGSNYMTAAQTDLSETFSCVASIGGGEGVEIQMAAMQAALSEELNGAGGCNEGFLRDDAILVITVLTDENDSSEGDPPDWYDAVVAAKGGNEEAVVVLTVVRDSDVDGGLCESGQAARMREFAEMFTYGQWGSVCQKSYGDMFVDAVSTIDTSCENFDPEG